MNASRGTRLPNRSRGNRIRKLLLSEYHEFSETILVESSFAETTRNGRGVRQVSLGLTPTRLIVAADILQTNPGFFCPPYIDASIESFELVSVYPLEYVTLSVFRRRRRRTLKARYTPSDKARGIKQSRSLFFLFLSSCVKQGLYTRNS